MKRATLTIEIEYIGDGPSDDAIKTALHGLAHEAAEKSGSFTGDPDVDYMFYEPKVTIETIGPSNTPKPTDDGTGPRVIAKFQPQADVNGYCIDIDGAWAFDVTAAIKAMGRKAALAIRDDQSESDELWRDWVADHPDKDHDGPFRASVEDAITDYFEALDNS